MNGLQGDKKGGAPVFRDTVKSGLLFALTAFGGAAHGAVFLETGFEGAATGTGTDKLFFDIEVTRD